MTTAALVALAVLMIGSLALWTPVAAAAEDLPWWAVAAGVPAALGIVAIVAAAAEGTAAGAAHDVAVVLGVAVAVLGGGPVATALLRGAESAGFAGPSREPSRSEDAPPGTVAGAVVDNGLRGGLWIGALERAAVAACLLIGQPGGIAVVVAVKGLGRYPEMRTPGASERFIIGTLASLLWAAAAAGVVILLT